MGSTSAIFVVKQLPVHPTRSLHPALLDLIVPHVVELTYTAWDLLPFARDILAEAGVAAWNRWFPGNPVGESGDPAPFTWQEARRAHLRAELDAVYAHLYGLTAEELAYILDTFPIVRRKDEAKWGEFRTKRLVMECYDNLTLDAQTGAIRDMAFAREDADVRRRGYLLILVFVLALFVLVGVWIWIMWRIPDSIQKTLFGGAITVLALVSLLGALAQITGIDLDRIWKWLRGRGSISKDFPFFVIGSYEKLMEQLFSDVSQPLIRDRIIEYLPQGIESGLDKLFQMKGRILIVGQTKSGKTRATAELCDGTGPAVLWSSC